MPFHMFPINISQNQIAYCSDKDFSKIIDDTDYLYAYFRKPFHNATTPFAPLCTSKNLNVYIKALKYFTIETPEYFEYQHLSFNFYREQEYLQYHISKYYYVNNDAIYIEGETLQFSIYGLFDTNVIKANGQILTPNEFGKYTLY